MLKGLHSVFENVFRHVTQVQVNVSARGGGVVQEGVHYPELNKFDVLLFKIVDGELAHDASPTAAGIFEASVGINSRGYSA